MSESARNPDPLSLSDALDLVQATHGEYMRHLEGCARCRADEWCLVGYHLEALAGYAAWAYGQLFRP